MLQLHKVFSIFIGTLARPIITYTKQYQLQKKTFTHNYMRNFFIFVGRKYHQIEIYLDKKFNSNEAEKLNKINEDAES